MKRLAFLKTCLFLVIALGGGPAGLAPGAQDKTKAPSPQGGKNPDQDYDFISDGSEFTIEKKGLTITPPQGWEIHTSQPNLTLLMQIPHTKDTEYQRTIVVRTFTGRRYMDETTAKEYEEIIRRKFSKSSISVQDYRIRNHMFIEMNDGREGILFYSEFVLEGVPLMQAHILLSTTERHFLITYTDVEAHFENDQSSRFLTEAWNSMVSVKLDGRTPHRFESLFFLAVAGCILAIFGLAFMFIRKWRAAKRYKQLATAGGLDDVELTQESQLIATTVEADAEEDGDDGELVDGDDGEPVDGDGDSWDTGVGRTKSRKSKKKEKKKSRKPKAPDPSQVGGGEYNEADDDDFDDEDDEHWVV